MPNADDHFWFRPWAVVANERRRPIPQHRGAGDIATSCPLTCVWEPRQIAASIQLSIFDLKRIDLNGFTYAEAPFLNGAQSNKKA